MSYYKDQEFEFVTRTLKILEQYDSLKIPASEKFEVTLLINSMVGLLVLPQQIWFDKLPTEIISSKKWGVGIEHIISIKQGEDKSVCVVARHLRNSLAHYRFTAFEKSTNDISEINFKDFDMQGNSTFEATISIAALEFFLKKFASDMLDHMNKAKMMLLIPKRNNR